MPQRMCIQPLRLSEICVKYVAIHIDDILKLEAHLDLDSTEVDRTLFQQLPVHLFHVISDKIISSGKLHDGNYQKILSDKTLSLEFTYSISIRDINNKAEFLEFIGNRCKNVVKIDLHLLLGRLHSSHIERENISAGPILASMVHLEWIDLRDCGIDDVCLKCIGSSCHKLRHLDVSGCCAITAEGIRGLCDPSLRPAYGNCTKLTHLYIRYVSDYFKETPIDHSFALLHCPDLQIIDSEKNALMVLKTLNLHSALEPTFKVKSITIDCAENDLEEPSSYTALWKSCPDLENLSIVRPDNLDAACLDGIAHLASLRRVEVRVLHLETEPFNPVLIELLQLIGGSLTSLCLQCQCDFDLRDIKRECPNLNHLTLTRCDPIHDAPLNMLGNTTFESLTNLKLSMTSFVTDDLVDLLSSPNLEVLSIGEVSCDSSSEEYLEQVLLNSPNTFSKLISVRFFMIEMDREMLIDFLGRAAALKSIAVRQCYEYVNGEKVRLDEREHFDELTKTNQWALKWEWNELCLDYMNQL